LLGQNNLATFVETCNFVLIGNPNAYHATDILSNMTEVNQQIIAERLALSRATVSRCFTNHPGINPMTRAKVFKVAAEVGYTHLENRTSKAKKPSARTTLGVLICSEEEEYNRQDYQSPGEQILAGVTECSHLGSASVEVIFVSPKDRSLDDPSYARIKRIRRRWKGIILIYPFPETVIRELKLLMPVVSLVEQFESAGIDCVDADHYKGISTAIEHLHANGHRRIGYFTRIYPVEATWSFRRYAAYVEKMARLHLPFSQEDAVNVFPSPEMDLARSYDHVAARVREGTTAWVCAADHQAYDLIQGLSQRGLKIPQDVSVTGFDGISTPPGCPELSTVEIPFREIGATGTRRLIERINKRFGSTQHVFIDCQFREGQSVAAPGTAKP